MAASGAAPENPYTPRFSRASRMLHWVHAIPFLVLLLTGLSLLIPEIKGVNLFGQRLASTLHIVAAGVFILGPIAIYASLPDRAPVHRDVRRLLRVGRLDLAWLRFAALYVVGFGVHEPPAGKFNTGQKLNTAYTVLTGLGLITTGVILAVNVYRKGLFDVGFVERVFPLHDIFMLLALPAVAIHLYLALVNPSTREALRGITRGVVHTDWARRHHPRWTADEDGLGLP